MDPKSEMRLVVVGIGVALLLSLVMVVFFESACFFYIAILLVMAFVGMIAFYIARIKAVQPKKDRAINRCPICGTKVIKDAGVLCPSWKTRTRRCDAGPFCSKKCLKEHHKQTRHEHNLMGK